MNTLRTLFSFHILLPHILTSQTFCKFYYVTPDSMMSYLWNFSNQLKIEYFLLLNSSNTCHRCHLLTLNVINWTLLPTLFVLFLPITTVVFKIFLCVCGPFIKPLLKLSQYCFCFIFWVFGCEACEILAPWPGIEPASFALEGEVLTTGLLGKSPSLLFLRTGVVTCFEGLNSLWLLCPWWLLREIVLMISVSPQRS